MKINAFCTADLDAALKHSDRVIFCGVTDTVDERVTVYEPYADGVSSKRIYIDGMTDFDLLAAACDHLLENDATAMIRASYDLNEAGIIEAKYKLSPIMLLHRLGVLDKCVIVGGVCLDNDDLDLMAQVGAPLVVTPIASAAGGYGYAPVSAAKKRGVRVGIGTFDGKYNAEHDVDEEARFMLFTSNAEMREENSLNDIELKDISEFK